MQTEQQIMSIYKNSPCYCQPQWQIGLRAYNCGNWSLMKISGKRVVLDYLFTSHPIALTPISHLITLIPHSTHSHPHPSLLPSPHIPLQSPLTPHSIPPSPSPQHTYPSLHHLSGQSKNSISSLQHVGPKELRLS